jgi:hypothetical protein
LTLGWSIKLPGTKVVPQDAPPPSCSAVLDGELFTIDQSLFDDLAIMLSQNDPLPWCDLSLTDLSPGAPEILYPL